MCWETTDIFWEEAVIEYLSLKIFACLLSLQKICISQLPLQCNIFSYLEYWNMKISICIDCQSMKRSPYIYIKKCQRHYRPRRLLLWPICIFCIFCIFPNICIKVRMNVSVSKGQLWLLKIPIFGLTNIDSDSNSKVPKIGNGPFSEQWHRCLFSLYLIDFSFYIYFTSIQCTSIAKGLTVVQALGSRVDRSPLIGWFLLRLSDFSLVGNITDHGRILYQTKR